jgi:hypothetical protein
MTVQGTDQKRRLRPLVHVRNTRAALVGALIAGWVSVAAAQSPDQFGGQQRADAAEQMIVLAVQQAVSSLPPTSGQSFSYSYDPQTLTFVASERLGPTAFLSTQTVGKGKAAFRFAASYFDLDDSFGPITYLVEPKDPESSSPGGLVKLGLDANARVAVFDLSASYGLTNRVELQIDLPISIVDAEALESFTTHRSGLSDPPLEARLQGPACRMGLEQCKADLTTLLESRDLVIRKETFSDLGFGFNSGTQAGVGRINVGAKGVLYTSKRFRLAALGQFFFPSPSEDQLAGPESAAILPRLIGQVNATNFLSLHGDAGYDYDFDDAELRRFVWNAGASIPGKRFTFDLGVGGSEYDTPIRWTPSQAEGSNERETFVITALDDNRLGTSFIDFRGGVKVRLAGRFVLSGAVVVPLNDQGFRPAALGTVGVEYYL